MTKKEPQNEIDRVLDRMIPVVDRVMKSPDGVNSIHINTQGGNVQINDCRHSRQNHEFNQKENITEEHYEEEE